MAASNLSASSEDGHLRPCACRPSGRRAQPQFRPSAAKLDVAFGTEQRVAAFGSAAARLMRAYAIQVEILRRMRNGGQQFVRVEHVHVNDGGQAVVGNLKKEGAKV
jgi:hypothetical protein